MCSCGSVVQTVQCKQIVLNTQAKKNKNGTIENTERKARTLETEIKPKKTRTVESEERKAKILKSLLILLDKTKINYSYFVTNCVASNEIDCCSLIKSYCD